MGKSVSAPATPDYVGAAKEQGAANVDAARASAKLSNPNIYGPLGTQTVTYGTPSFDQTAYDKAMSDYQANQGRSAERPDIGKFTTQTTNDDGNVTGSNIDQQGYQTALMDWLNTTGKAPTREQYTTTADADVPTIRQTLTPEAQATLEAQQRVQRQLANLGEQGIGTARDVLSKPFNPNLPDVQTSISGYGNVAETPNLSSYGQAVGGPQGGLLAPTPNLSSYGSAGGLDPNQYGNAGGVDANQYGLAGGINPNQYGSATGINPNQYGSATGLRPNAYGLANRNLDLSNVAAMPVNAGTTGQAAILSRLAPQIERSQEATRTRLANQGLVPGTKAYETAMIEENQRGNDLFTQAALQGINLDIGANAQGFGQAVTSGQFGNQAVAQNYGQGVISANLRNDAINQNFNRGLAATQLGNQAISQNFNQGVTGQQLTNQAIGQNYGQGVTSANLRNAAIGQNYGLGLKSRELENAAVAQNQQTALAQQQADAARQQQLYGQDFSSRQLSNTALSQNQQAALAQQQAENAAQQLRYQQALQNAQFGNTAQSQSLQQQLALRNQPLNEITGLMSGSQINMPQFQGYQGQNIAPAPIFAGTQAAGQNALNQYGIQQSGANAATSGLFGLASAGLGGAGGFAKLFG